MNGWPDLSFNATFVAQSDKGFAIMANGKFVSYLRVSTKKQGASGLGLEAQRETVANYLNGGSWSLVAELVEVESGGKADRPKLAEALALCRNHGATLVVAKLDRLARDAHFLLGLQNAGVDFVAVDMPSANRLTVGLMAVVAEEERRLASTRTKAALAAAKARGVQLGGFRGRAGTTEDCAKARAAHKAKANAKANDLSPLFATMADLSHSAAARSLNDAGVLSPSGKAGSWTAASVSRVRARLQG
jgi:DNA invertase Pin-like site-specific DNA recombinase